jgi:hypothetical protein
MIRVCGWWRKTGAGLLQQSAQVIETFVPLLLVGFDSTQIVIVQQQKQMFIKQKCVQRIQPWLKHLAPRLFSLW